MQAEKKAARGVERRGPGTLRLSSLLRHVEDGVLEATVRATGGLEGSFALGNDRLSVSIGTGVGVIENHNAAHVHPAVVDRELTVGVVSLRLAGVSFAYGQASIAVIALLALVSLEP